MPIPRDYTSPLVTTPALRILSGPEGAAGLSVVPFAQTIATAADGTFTTAIPVDTFASAPVVQAAVLVASARAHAVTLTAVSATSISGFVKRSRTLPAVIAVLADLQNYDPWESPGVVSVCLMAQDAS